VTVEKKKRRRDHHRVYVVELRSEVTERPRFKRKNRGWVSGEGKRCFYVGMSAHDPECRYRQHKFEVKEDVLFECDCPNDAKPRLNPGANALVLEFGVGLRPEFYEHIEPIKTRVEAEAEEERVGELLQREGHAAYWA